MVTAIGSPSVCHTAILPAHFKDSPNQRLTGHSIRFHNFQAAVFHLAGCCLTSIDHNRNRLCLDVASGYFQLTQFICPGCGFDNMHTAIADPFFYQAIFLKQTKSRPGNTGTRRIFFHNFCTSFRHGQLNLAAILHGTANGLIVYGDTIVVSGKRTAARREQRIRVHGDGNGTGAAVQAGNLGMVGVIDWCIHAIDGNIFGWSNAAGIQTLQHDFAVCKQMRNLCQAAIEPADMEAVGIDIFIGQCESAGEGITLLCIGKR